MYVEAGICSVSFRGASARFVDITEQSGCRLNGRPLQRLVNETVDFGHADPWTIPIRGTTELAPLKDEHKQGYSGACDFCPLGDNKRAQLSLELGVELQLAVRKGS